MKILIHVMQGCIAVIVIVATFVMLVLAFEPMPDPQVIALERIAAALEENNRILSGVEVHAGDGKMIEVEAAK